MDLDWTKETDLTNNVLKVIKETPRPISLIFVPLKTLRVAEETVKAEHHSKQGRKTVVVTFGEGSMGIEFAPKRTGGGCIIYKIIKGGVAEKLYKKRLRKSMVMMLSPCFLKCSSFAVVI
jgi:hypothetical protein